MAHFQEQEIQLSRINLDSGNPRHRYLESQREIIEWMTSGNGRIGEKLLNLAKDIVEYGLNPAERIMVIEDENNNGQYIAIEGNRRVTALKLLNNPDTAPTKEWASKFAKIAANRYTPIKKVFCILFDDPSYAYHFIELKHMGESGGAGIVSWDAEQKARHDHRSHRRSRHHKALAVLDFVRNSDTLGDETRSYAGEGFPITTLDRLLSDREFRDFIGLGLSEDGDITFTIDPSEAVKPILKIIRDFGSGDKNVRDVINKGKRDKYRNEFKGAYLPDRKKVLIDPVTVDAAASSTSGKTRPSAVSRRYADPRNRRFIVIPGSNLPIDAQKHNRARRVFEELRRVPLRDRDAKPQYPNAGILLLRLFIEMSVDTFIHTRKLTHPSPTGWKDISLTERTRAVLADLQKLNVLDVQEAKVISKALGDKNKIANPNSLNDFAHNPHQLPNPNDLIDVWDIYTKFLLRLWENIT
ncbi:MAG: hypothetical protein ACOYU4_00715 [Thermodesulfobacteriota bacterium]